MLVMPVVLAVSVNEIKVSGLIVCEIKPILMYLLLNVSIGHIIYFENKTK